MELLFTHPRLLVFLWLLVIYHVAVWVGALFVLNSHITLAIVIAGTIFLSIPVTLIWGFRKFSKMYKSIQARKENINE